MYVTYACLHLSSPRPHGDLLMFEMEWDVENVSIVVYLLPILQHFWTLFSFHFCAELLACIQLDL